MNILFSQVREDPNVELFIDTLISNKKRRYLLIGSGGCTVLSLLSNLNDDNLIIDVIDQNIEQIQLIKLKLSVISHFVDTDSILSFFEGNFSKDRYDMVLDQLVLDPICKSFWQQNMNTIYYGINRSGTFERLFKELVTSNYNFEKVFDRENLISKFGENAVINSLNNEFYDHFRSVIAKYNKYDIKENYFYHQIVNDKYDKNCLPPYFNNLENIVKNLSKVNFINADFFEYVSTTNNNLEKYDLIHTSNITDWLNIAKLEILLSNLDKILEYNGYIVMRRLNGDYILRDIVVKNDYQIVTNVPHDKSEFYAETIVVYKNIDKSVYSSSINK